MSAVLSEIKRITLIIATFNGARTLPDTLDSIKNLSVTDAFEFNTIIVDNNSSDSTSSILKNFDSPFPMLLIYQKRQGKNAALNTVFERDDVLGELLIFSDDDVIFPQDFLRRYYELSENFQDFYIFGGAIEPHFTVEPPENLLQGIDAVVAYAITPEISGYNTGEINPVKIHGPNLALRKEVFKMGIRFDESIGPNGGKYVMGSETELLYRLSDMGYKAYFDQEIVVRHIIRPEQITVKWLSGRAYKAGCSFLMHQLKQRQNMKVILFFGYPRWAFFKFLKSRLKGFFTHSKSVKDYQLVWETNHLKGYCDEYKKHFQRDKI